MLDMLLSYKLDCISYTRAIVLELAWADQGLVILWSWSFEQVSMYQILVIAQTFKNLTLEM